MNHFQALFATATLAVVAGCAAPSHLIQIREPLDVPLAMKMLAPGPNTIHGSALIRQQGGGVVTCAGQKVYLVPATGYARERLGVIYGSRKLRGPYEPRYEFQPNLPDYEANMRSTTCNAQGLFRFEGVADGEFFLQTTIAWQVGYIIQGGNLLDRATVSGGQTVEVTLAP